MNHSDQDPNQIEDPAADNNGVDVDVVVVVDPPAPSLDEMTMRQQESIDSEISSKNAFVGPIESLSVLKEEYVSDPVYLQKIEELSKEYPHLRRMRPDGNCFFRAFSFAVLESLQGDELDKFRTAVVESKELLANYGFNQFTVDDFYETFLELLDRVIATPTANLEAEFQAPSLADYLVVYLRIVTSAELRRSADFYSNFIEEKTVEEFCQLEVEPMYKESDHIHIIALTKALGVPVRVVYMDRGPGARHDFPDDSHPSIIMLYRPGHYDILYAH